MKPAPVVSMTCDYFDNPYSDLALKFALETAGFNFLRQTNTKVPQTEQGMNGLKMLMPKFASGLFVTAALLRDLGLLQNALAITNFDQNILTKGYYVYKLADCSARCG